MTLQLNVPQTLVERMRLCLARGGVREIGGWLVAEQISAGHFELVDFTVDFSIGTLDRFQSLPKRHDGQFDNILRMANGRKGRVDYLGEWHSHPTFPPKPSDIDIATMKQMIEGTGPSFAALLIVRLQNLISIEATVTIFQRNYHPMSGCLIFGESVHEHK